MTIFYRIQIKELLDPHWAEWFEQMTIIHAADGTTILEGVPIDQAALYGLISKVRDLGLTLLAVQSIAKEPAAHASDADGSSVDD